MSKASSYQRRARDFAQRENWDAALAELRQAIASDAANPMLHNQMGDLFLRKEEVQQACLHFEKAIDLYSELGLHANAVALCRKVIRLCPSRVEVRFRLARLRQDQGLQAETTAAFADYIEHVPARSDGDVRHLEERCRDIVEQFPQSAPIGKILEKLEAAHAFAAAFEIVQRLAQRAADAGDDEAARRYTTKMRSLRVLVEARGGDLPPQPRTEDARPVASVAAEFGVRALDPADDAEPPAVEPPAHPSAPASLQLEDIRGTIARAAFGDEPEPSPRASEAPAVELAGGHAAAPPELELDVPAATDASQIEAPDAIDTTDAAESSEYELPETSLDEIAHLFGKPADAAPPEPETGVFEIELPEPVDATAAALGALPDAPDAVSDPMPTPGEASAGLGPLPPLGLGATSPAPSESDTTVEDPDAPGASDDQLLRVADAAGAAATPGDGWRETFAAVSEWSLDEPVTPEIDLPAPAPAASAAPPDAATPHEASAGAWIAPAIPASAPLATPQELSAPVWVPDESSGDLAGPISQEGGSTHELVEVIDTFRRQMALALGDDAAARYDLGVAYFEMGLYEEALTEFEVARGSTALRERSLEMMAACMAMQGRHAEILDLLAPLVQVQADPSLGLGLRFSMGVACEALGRRSEARHHFEAVAQVDGSYRDVRARLQRF